MLTLQRRSPAKSTSLHPWDAPHAAPEDRAVGLELELIELIHRLDELGPHDDAGRAEVDREIAQVLADLEHVADLIAA